MTITPFAARAPYIAVAAASFKTVISSISFGLIPAIEVVYILSMSCNSDIFGISVPSNGSPSNTHNGSCAPFIEEVPRILIFTGAPVDVTAESPATCPAKTWSME